MREAKFERAGVFAFSPQENTLSAAMEDAVPEEARAWRADKIREIQYEIMDEHEKKRVGGVLTVLCEGFDESAKLWYGRSFADSPDVDGRVFFKARPGTARPGDFIDIVVDDVLDGDLFGYAALAP